MYTVYNLAANYVRRINNPCKDLADQLSVDSTYMVDALIYNYVVIAIASLH